MVLTGINVEANVVEVPKVVVASVPCAVTFVSFGVVVSVGETSLLVGNAGASPVDKLGALAVVRRVFMVMGVCVL